MKLYIPEIGDKLVLTADWTFDLYNERRNTTLMEFIGDPREEGYRIPVTAIPCTIPAGETLKIDRIYIRKGGADFSSLSFLWVNMRTKRKEEERYATGLFGNGPAVRQQYTRLLPARPVRFWAKLKDTNNIEFKVV